MNQDRELLELAAKAAGLDDAKWEDMEGWGEVRHGFSNAMWSQSLNDAYGSGYWNPLVDDGDALRLAVKLGMEVYVDTHPDGCSCTEVQSITFDKAGNHRVIYCHEGYGPEKATRLAITRAAAEIGKAMQDGRGE